MFPYNEVEIISFTPIYRVMSKEVYYKDYLKTNQLADTWQVEYLYNGEKRAKVIESSFLINLAYYTTKHNDTVYDFYVMDKTMLLFDKHYGEKLELPDYESMTWYQYEKERIQENLKRDWYDMLEEKCVERYHSHGKNGYNASNTERELRKAIGRKYENK